MASASVSWGIIGDDALNGALGVFRNCCIDGGSSSGGISIARSSGGSSLSISSALLCVVLSRPTSTMLPLLLLLSPLSTLERCTASPSSIDAILGPLPFSVALGPLHELLIPAPLPRPLSSISLPSPLSSKPDALPASSSASEDSSNRLPPNCRLDRCRA